MKVKIKLEFKKTSHPGFRNLNNFSIGIEKNVEKLLVKQIPDKSVSSLHKMF
jgi:hypothetical protein